MPERQEQALDVVALVEVDREVDHLLDGEAGAPHVARAAVDAVGAVVHAEVGQQDLEQRDAAAVRRVGSGRCRCPVVEPTPLPSREFRRGAPAGGAGRVVLRRIGKDRELVLDRRHRPPSSCSLIVPKARAVKRAGQPHGSSSMQRIAAARRRAAAQRRRAGTSRRAARC